MYLSHHPASISNQRHQLELARNSSNADASLPLLITEWSSSPSVLAHPARLSALSVLHNRSVLYGGFV